jgi:hypothetical protein
VVEGVGRIVLSAVYYLGRVGQLIGMGMLLVDIVTAGPLGPNFRLFAVGVTVFLAGWGLAHAVRRDN